MRPINVTLDSTTWEMAKNKQNFSAWIRKQLHDEFNYKQLKLDLEFETQGNIEKRQLLKDIIDGKKEWVPIHGWVSCEVEVIDLETNEI